MDTNPVNEIRSTIQNAEIVVPCDNFKETLSFFTGKLGFSVAVIFPADNPTVGVLNGHGIRIRLEQGTGRSTHTLRLNCDLSKVSFGGARAHCASEWYSDHSAVTLLIQTVSDRFRELTLRGKCIEDT